MRTATLAPAISELTAALLAQRYVMVTTRHGQEYGPIDVIERRAGGFRFGQPVRAGFGPQDLFIAFGDITSAITL